MVGVEFSFQKLNVWKEAKKLVVEVYQLLDNFPKFENRRQAERNARLA